MKWIQKHGLLVGIGVLFVAVNVLFFFVSPQELVSYIGVENSYLITFVVAAVGGLSAFTGTVLYGLIATFGAGGSSPWLLALAGGVGIFISDSIFFYLASRGRTLIPSQWNSWVLKIQSMVQKYPQSMVLVFVYCYLSVFPFPNDILMIALAVAGYTYRRIALVVLAGSVTIAFLTASFGRIWFM